MKAIFKIALAVTLMGVTAGNLPWLIKRVQTAQLHLIMESRSYNWGRAWTPPSR